MLLSFLHVALQRVLALLARRRAKEADKDLEILILTPRGPRAQSPHPPSPAVGDPAELLDVDVQQLPGAILLVAKGAPVGRSEWSSRCMPWRRRTP